MEIDELANEQLKEEIKKREGHLLGQLDGIYVVQCGEEMMETMSPGGMIHEETTPNYEYYDTNGNRFYSNYATREEAEAAVKGLQAQGKNAHIGPASPRFVEGRLERNTDSAVGVYVEPVKVKSHDDDGR